MSTIPGKEAAPGTHYYRVYCTNKTGEGCVGVCDSGVRDYFLLNQQEWERSYDETDFGDAVECHGCGSNDAM
jgi:hypothetical protein